MALLWLLVAKIPGFPSVLGTQKRKPNLKALYGPIVLSSSTMTSPFIPFLISKIRTPIAVSLIILLRYIHAFFLFCFDFTICGCSYYDLLSLSSTLPSKDQFFETLFPHLPLFLAGGLFLHTCLGMLFRPILLFALASFCS